MVTTDRTVRVWMERECKAPQWMDWFVGIDSYEPKAIAALERACPGYGGASPIRQMVGREHVLGMFARTYHLNPNPLPEVLLKLRDAGYEPVVIERPESPLAE